MKVGDKIKVKLIEIDKKTGKFKLSHKALLPKPEGYVERAPRPMGDRPQNDRPKSEHSRIRPERPTRDNTQNTEQND